MCFRLGAMSSAQRTRHGSRICGRVGTRSELASPFTSRTAAINSVFQFGQDFQDTIEGHRLGQVHFCHCRVVAAQSSDPPVGRQNSESAWPCEIIAGPPGGEKPALPRYDAIAQAGLGESRHCDAMERERRRIGIVAGESVGRLLVRRTMMLRVENRCFLPETSLRFERHNVASPVVESLSKGIGYPRAYPVLFPAGR